MSPRLLISLYVVLFAGILVIGGLSVMDAREEYRQRRAVEARNQVRLEEAERELHELEIKLQRLRTDPAYVERMIRSKLGYIKADESVFRFGD